MKSRLSSDYLYHFTREFDTVLKILDKGLRFGFCDESIPYKNINRKVFSISFCDIRYDQSKAHTQCYGSYGIALTKDWAIRNSVTPVRYIHENSIGLSKTYINHRQNYHIIRELCRKYPDKFQFETLYLFVAVLYVNGKLKNNNLYEELNSSFDGFNAKFEEINSEFFDLYEEVAKMSKEQALLINKYISSLTYKITELHNEFLDRDYITRRYSGNFKCPLDQKSTERIFYDEKEWRVIFNQEFTDSDNDLRKKFDTYLTNGFLPEEYNLTFESDDIVAIIVKEEEEKKSIIEFINDNSRSFNDIHEKIYIDKEFNEDLGKNT
ncbi:hypothetical protein C0585_00390 [Candidatus Woesearchaeota archaeon]|nr:MAG: hypothetical protein C0585_00390 [Candidatus Woesearchaeota archaeon]